MVIAAGTAMAQDINQRVIRFGFGNPEISPSGQGVKHFADLVDKKSGGKMKVRLFGGAVLGADMAMQTALTAGYSGNDGRFDRHLGGHGKGIWHSGSSFCIPDPRRSICGS